MNIERDLATTLFVGTSLIAAVFVFGYTALDKEKTYKEKTRELSSITQQAVYLSAGEDRIWSLQEQREFLDATSLKNVILTENVGIYLVPSRAINNSVDVLTISSTYLGNINHAALESYITQKTAQKD